MGQLCGFNSLMYFSATIFTILGFENPTLTSLVVAITNFIMTCAALLLIDRLGGEGYSSPRFQSWPSGYFCVLWAFCLFGCRRTSYLLILLSLQQLTKRSLSLNERLPC